MVSYSDFRKSIDITNPGCAENVKSFIENINKIEINAFITVCNEEALKCAEESDKRFREGNPRKLEGMVIAVKDNISTLGVRTTCASKMLENFVPVYDATVIEKIKQAGGIIIGKTNMDEFAMGSSNETSYFGPVLHPKSSEHVPGGSSGGSAASVAAGMAHAALGSDTGGSVRQPASLCGVYGLKPTYGSVSRYGLVAFASSLDQIGVFANSAEDTALLFDVISGKDEKDTTSAPFEPANTFSSINSGMHGKFCVGVLPEKELSSCSEDVLTQYRTTLQAVKDLGGELKEISFDGTNAWIPAYYILATAEASSNLARFDGVRYGFRADEEISNGDITSMTRSLGFGDEVKRRIMLGTYVLSSGYYDAYYKKAQQARRLIYNNYKTIFADCDFVILPTAAAPAFKLNEKMNDPIAMYLSDFFTTSANLAGIPALSIPVGLAQNGMPIGMQIQAEHFCEDKIMKLAKALEYVR